jgi:hypothetical protein
LGISRAAAGLWTFQKGPELSSWSVIACPLACCGSEASRR